MGQISLDEMDNYASSGNGQYFQLKDDGDTARVRFLYSNISELRPYVIHECKVNGSDKPKYVNCLRRYDEPVDKCPLCAAGYKAIPKLFLKLYNEDAGECQVWERGKTYASRISNLAAHFEPLCDEIVEISRIGKKGDMQTRYEFLPLENSPVNLDDYDCAEPLGWMVLEKSATEMNEYIDLGDFQNGSADVAQQRSSDVTRRTPTNTNGQPRRAF